MSKRYIYYGSQSAAFNPLTITGLQFYVNQNDATPSLWTDQSTNAIPMANGAATAQPVVSALSVDFDGVNDQLVNNTANRFSGDSSGIVFFSGYRASTQWAFIFASCDTAGANNLFHIAIEATGVVSINGKVAGTNNYVWTTNAIPVGSYYYGYIKSTGTAWEINLNGVVETLAVVLGSNNGNWFADIPSRDNITLGSRSYSGITYGDAKVNKIIISNAALSAGEITSINTFMSVPSN